VRSIERAKEGQRQPRSVGLPRAGARLPERPGELPQEPAFLLRWKDWKRGTNTWNPRRLRGGAAYHGFDEMLVAECPSALVLPIIPQELVDHVHQSTCA
jgi:hypothetical protein